MSKNIILLSDGTGNGAAKRNKTNVWRLYDALDLHREDQVAFYDDGVGSQEFLPLKIIGGAVGWGLKRNVRELYKFLCRNYREGDRIYLFGFSRGAFTVRMLAGMIVYCGVYTEYKNEQGLHRATVANYNAFRSRFKTGLLTRGLRTFFGKTTPVPTRYKPDIEFVGVYDTVDAYGLPIDELAIVWDRLIYPIRFPDYKLSNKVKKACHALSVDDERLTFHPVLWDESDETDPGRIEQVWFPGVHSDVGGGYPKHSLSLVALDWMVTRVEAEKGDIGSPGLHLIQQRRDEFMQHSDWHGPQHDSRALAGAYYRYKPRDIAVLCDNTGTDGLFKQPRVVIKRPRIHRSVMERIAGNVTPYAPTGLPEHYEVVSTRGTPPVFETEEESRARVTAMQPVQQVIARRRILYFALLLGTLGFLASPFVLGCMRAGHCPATSGPFDAVLEMAARMLPDLVAPWIRVLRNYPNLFHGLVLFFTVLFVLKARLWAKTQWLATQAWAALKKNNRRPPH